MHNKNDNVDVPFEAAQRFANKAVAIFQKFIAENYERELKKLSHLNIGREQFLGCVFHHVGITACAKSYSLITEEDFFKKWWEITIDTIRQAAKDITLKCNVACKENKEVH